MLRCGLLGEHLEHSYSPEIHRFFGDYDYQLFEVKKEDIVKFLADDSWDALNVTVPYKKTVLPFMSGLSENARRAGCINTIIRRSGGLYGDNTDIAGFQAMMDPFRFSLKGKKALVLGSGGAGAAVSVALEELGAKPVTVSRSGPDNYSNLDKHADAFLIVNATPVGMYPNNGLSPVDLLAFPECKLVADVIYNPARTSLLMQAEKLGIPTANGLYMLIAQAKQSAELFLGKPIPDSAVKTVYRTLQEKMQNIILIGMPGCGKTTVASAISKMTGRRMYDSDESVFQQTGLTPEQMILQFGEQKFRLAESAAIKKIGCVSGAVIATGGGAVTEPENYPSLHQNGMIVWLGRTLSALENVGRPISVQTSPEALFSLRAPMYRKFADITVDAADTPEETAKKVLMAVHRRMEQSE